VDEEPAFFQWDLGKGTFAQLWLSWYFFDIDTEGNEIKLVALNELVEASW